MQNYQIQNLKITQRTSKLHYDLDVDLARVQISPDILDQINI